ncbi:MAG: hypothetical protein CMK09_12955 [Ponticaulis sp.]|nr:hypothetical protein [Ponticaulis sp.]|tara:strand:- start:6334 stop:7395 length:1062 start_codon:yes stop_codon:yes gene_type:complete
MDIVDATYPPPEGDFTTNIDHDERVVTVDYDDVMPPRIAAWRPVLGCVQLPSGAKTDDIALMPSVGPDISVPNYDELDWPMGDKDAWDTLSDEQQTRLDKLVSAAFDGETYKGESWGIVVVKDGKIVAESYDDGYGMHIGGQTHSAAKSFAASVAGLGVLNYGLDVKHTPALEEWSSPGDPRGEISVDDLIRMSSGLYTEGNGSPLMDVYRQGGTVSGRATSNILDQPPGTRFLYSPPDTQLMVRSVRQAVKDDSQFLSLPFTELFWKLGMTRTTPTSDWNGDFLMSGQTYSTARNFARFGMLYLADGIWNGEGVLPEGWSDYVSTPGPRAAKTRGQWLWRTFLALWRTGWLT